MPQHRVGFSVGDPQAPIQLSTFDLIVEYKSEIYASMKNYQDKYAYMNALNLRLWQELFWPFDPHEVLFDELPSAH